MRLVKSLKVRPHLLGAIGLGVMVYLALPASLGLASRAILAWDAALLIYLAQIGVMMFRAGIADIRQRAAIYDEGATLILILSDIAAVASIAALVIELASAKTSGGYGPWQISLAAATLILSWTFVHVIFALHYAHDYYSASAGPTLEFPGEKHPLYGDFLYFSFVIGVANATADVTILSPGVRRIALAHGILAFFFNTTIVAMAINIAVSLLNP